MIPSIDARLASMMTAVEKVMIPALGTADALAIEQAGLLLGHLKILRDQFDYAVRYEQVELAELHDLAATLLARAAGGAETTKTAAALLAAQNCSAGAFAPGEVRDGIALINGAVAALVSAAGVDGDAEFRKSSARIVLCFSQAKALRDRGWFSGSGFETGGDALPDVATLARQLYENTAEAAASKVIP